ncbi:glycoside hydrolase family 32 protein [Corynebacterium timonense]|uniref:beta-fructofuranosidase n=1 Tax=Corynebacterium timonense TaxID=441500 RepID=A0A1H1SR35_9CORY|nr:glycoside hydrolase family 32 protein [Corynebacterium timonense]SDS50480.1 beta-fructofuranosidase [Corynebacterium timonense]
MTYRPMYHLSPPQGRLNDPNGLVLSGQTLHAFYQHDPAFPAGKKRTGWGHAVTTLGEGTWRHLPDALYPDFPYDRHGCYSGSAAVDGERVALLYTGNLTVDGERYATQNLVEVTDLDGPAGGYFRRSPNNPLIGAPAPGYTAHYRDPHVTRGADGRWRMLLGAQRADLAGAVVMYTSDDLDVWRFEGELTFAGLSRNLAAAYMWECPNLVRLVDEATGAERDVLVFCPQFRDVDECGYVVGTLTGTHFEVETDYTPVDYGHEFYAPQLIAHGDGALMLGWMGLPGRDDTPTLAAEGWVHQLTLPRRVRLRGGRLVQELILPAHPDMLVERVEVGAEPLRAQLIDATGDAPLTLTWTPSTPGRGTLALEKSGLVRWAECAAGEVLVTADGAAVEVTAAGGEVAFSSAVFSRDGAPWERLEVQ